MRRLLLGNQELVHWRDSGPLEGAGRKAARNSIQNHHRWPPAGTNLATSGAYAVAIDVGAVGLLVRATNRNPSQLMVVLLAIWVVSPFMGLLWSSIVSNGWSVPDPRDALRRDAGCSAELFGHLRG